MERANWTYLVASALVLSTGISVAGAKATHHDKLSGVRSAITARGHHGHWKDATTTTTVVTTTTRPATTTTHATTTTAAPAPTTTTAPPTTTTTTTAPPPPAGTFLSYPHQSAPQSFSGTDVVVANRSYVGFGSVALTISNARNVTLLNLDFDGNVGDIFLINVTGTIRIENIRARNTGNGTIGSGHSNVIQFNNSWQGAPNDGVSGVRNVQAYGGDTEDMISVYKSGGVDSSHPLVLSDLHLESPLPPSSEAWSSGSGTCVNLADAGGHDIILQNSTLLNCGAVGIQMNEPTRVVAQNNVVYGAARTTSNVGLSQWSGSSCSTCTGNAYRNNRVWWVKPSGSGSAMWMSGNYPVADVGNAKQDATIVAGLLHVVL
jgi:hypothetical protein